MSRVLLISANTLDDPYPVYPLGMSVVGGALAEAGHQVTLHDIYRAPGEEVLRKTIAALNPDYVGLSIRNIDNVDSHTAFDHWTGDALKTLAGQIRSATAAPLILGGAGFSLLPEELLNHLQADYGVAGSGESAMVELLDALERGQHPQRLFKPRHTGQNAISPPAWSEAILPDYLRDKAPLGLHTKRGCPHRCSYCAYPLIEGTTIHSRDPREVVDDLRQAVVRFHAKEFFFTDAVFNDCAGSHLALVEEMLRADLDIRWSAYFQPRAVDERAIALMQRAGLAAVECGSDAVTTATLKGLAKPFGIEDIFAFQHLCNHLALPCAHFVIFGGPGETPESLEQGLSNLDRLEGGIVFAFSGIRLHRHTPLHGLAVRKGMIREDDSLLRPVFYHSPDIDREAMENRLHQAFHGRRDRFYPPEQGMERMRVLRRMGFGGLLWDTLAVFTRRARQVQDA